MTARYGPLNKLGQTEAQAKAVAVKRENLLRGRVLAWLQTPEGRAELRHDDEVPTGFTHVDDYGPDAQRPYTHATTRRALVTWTPGHATEQTYIIRWSNGMPYALIPFDHCPTCRWGSEVIPERNERGNWVALTWAESQAQAIDPPRRDYIPYRGDIDGDCPVWLDDRDWDW